LPEASSCHLVPNMSNLAQRLKAVQAPVEQIVPDLNQFSMADLETYAISFGTAHKGHTFQYVWDTGQNWVHWFTSHYSSSKKTAHRFFIKFVEMKVERAELTGTQVPLTTAIENTEPPVMGSGNPYPKSKAKAQAKGHGKGATESARELEHAIEDYHLVMEEEAIINAAMTSADVSHLETRMLHMENALSQVIAHLERLNVQNPQSTSSESKS